MPRSRKRKPLLNGNTPLILKVAGALIAYGILVGQVWAIDQRLARVEVAILGTAFHKSATPPIEAAERPR